MAGEEGTPPASGAGAPRSGGTGERARRIPSAGVLGSLLGGLAALLALLALRTRRDARRRDGAGGRAVRPDPRRAAEGTGGPPARGSRRAEILEFLGGLRPGTALGRWTLLRIGEERDGAIPVRMSVPGGEPFDLEIRRRDPEGPAAPGEDGSVAVYLVGVAGGSATPEDAGLGAMTLAAALAEAGREPPAWLRMLRQRQDAAGGEAG